MQVGATWDQGAGPSPTAPPEGAAERPTGEVAIVPTDGEQEAGALGRAGGASRTGGTSRSGGASRTGGDERAGVASHSSSYESPGRSVLSHPFLVGILALLGLVGGVGFGYLSAPTYTAESRLIVGRTSDLVNLAAVPGLAVAGEQVASNYSRLAGTGMFDAALARHLGHAPTGTVSASPIPGASVIRMSASDTTTAKAVALATAGAQALADVVSGVNQQTAAATANLAAGYRSAATQLETDNQQVATLQQQIQLLDAQIGTKVATPDQTALQANLRQQAIAAASAVDVDKLQVNTAQSQYQSQTSPSQLAEQAISPLGGAASTGSNHSRLLEIGALVGLVGMAIVGVALAVALDLRRVKARRRPRAVRLGR